MGYEIETSILYGSSLRIAPVEQTLRRARELGPTLGITRVTEITRLDRIGIPVFAGIRPGARPGSLCVTAGKGVTPNEACASAWMEAIEYALAEPGRSPVETVQATADRLPDGDVRPDAVTDFCPLLRVQIPPDAPMPCVRAEELNSGSSALVPAELVFLPGTPSSGAHYFGSSSNGLASGNSLMEATVHGLAEVIENDIRSFHLVHDASVPVYGDTLPTAARELADRIEAARLKLYVRHLNNDFGLPCFSAAIVDPEADSHMLINGGHGCHPHRQIALIRAICEAAQSRLSVIHGGRDDLTDTHDQIRDWDEQTRRDALERLLRTVTDSTGAIPYDDAPDCAPQTPDLPSAFALMADRLAAMDIRRIYRVVFTAMQDDLQVVKIVAPLLEEFEPGHPRAGRRLRAYWQEMRRSSA